MSYFDILDRVKPRMSTVATPVATLSSGDETIHRETSRVLVVDNEDAGSTFVTVPLSTAALDAERFLLRLHGRLVGAEQANANGQMWATSDLEFGLPSVAGGPLNWLHQERTVIGALTGADLHVGDDPHIQASAVVWSFLYPEQSRVIEAAAASASLYYSMECISGSVQCAGPAGCGAVMPYPDALHRTERACAHIRERASARRFIDPIFQGAAVIVPPIQPGWAGAHAQVVRQAAAAMEASPSLAGFTDGDEALAAQILAFVSAGSGNSERTPS